MHITSIELTAANLHRCHGLWADRRAYGDGQFTEAMNVARRLLSQECAIGSIVLEDDRPRGYCLTVAVAECFADRYLRDPYPQLGKDLLLHRAAGDRRAILTRHEIGERNAGAGLQLVVLSSNVDDASPDLATVLGVSMQSFQEVHRGYRTARIINEAFGEYATQVLVTSGSYDVRRTFELFPGAPIPSVLGIVTREDAMARHHAMLPLFVYSSPRIGFTPGEQRLLRAALSGGTDDALSARLGISLSSVKARWTRILQRAGSRVPGLFDDVPMPQRANRRGTQIRHLILGYVRANPSELTPYATSASRSPASCHQRVLTAAGGER